MRGNNFTFNIKLLYYLNLVAGDEDSSLYFNINAKSCVLLTCAREPFPCQIFHNQESIKSYHFLKKAKREIV